MNPLLSHCLLLAASFGAARCIAAEPAVPPLGMSIYTNFCVSPMSDDLYGSRITLRHLPDGDLLVYEYTDGSTHSLLAENLVLDAASHSLHFDLHGPDGKLVHLSARFADGGRALTVKGDLFNDPNVIVKLKKASRLAAPTKNCK